MTFAVDPTVAYRRRRERPAVRFPATAPAPVTGGRRSMIGYVDRSAVERAVSLVLQNGDRDPLTYVDAETWLNRSGADAGLSDIERNAVLSDPRVKAVVLALLRGAMAIGDERRAKFKAREPFAAADPNGNPELGWRVWQWAARKERLRSPVQGTLWEGVDLRIDNWSDASALRGVAGIHALHVPIDWRLAPWPAAAVGKVPNAVTGIVERFGRYVLGTEGWRAEWVVIRKLLAPSTTLGLKLENIYPEAEVCYEDR